ncbi:MAG: hypothetical protein GXO71_06685 [Caldiserica bacterium]|nr:hypothetical protein [Caldisericota bacterium]
MIKGILKKDRVILEEKVNLPEGIEVTVLLPPKYHLLEMSGRWKDRKDLDKVIKEIYKSRNIKK